ncbi:MAG: hypothetical protein JXA18_17630 [Chitinispirillaceae bacterium]|nr:hypothetical protein [Chitinispirillaceae bacterium]
MKTVIGLIAAILVCQTEVLSELKAFPSAEGYGRLAKGGRGGRVVEVTNLNDEGAGSLRAAIDETGPRTIVFTISGVINLKSKLLVTGTKGNGNFTLAGQTAPGKGICIHGWTFGMIGGEHVIIRHIRTRIGTSSGNTMDGMGMASANISIFDHCSVSWTIDEAFSSRSAKNITLQRTLISEALNEAGHKNYDPGTQHGYAASISGDIGSFHHNLLAHCAGRNWSLAGGLSKSPAEFAGRLDIRNNVVYNWRSRTTDGGAHEVNFVNNYYKPGPAIQIKVALNAQIENFPGTQSYYFAGNVMPGYFDESNQEKGRKISYVNRDQSSVTWNVFVDQPFFESYIETQKAGDAYEDVLDNVGCNVPMLDDHDKRIIEETRKGTTTYKGSKTGYPGLIDNEKDCGGLENYPEIKRPSDWDSDHDGMPDAWESAHGLNPKNADDRNNTDLSTDGYTNLEMYLNELAGDSVSYAKTAITTAMSAVTQTTVRVFDGKLALSLKSAAKITVSRIDISGKIVDVLHTGILPAGSSGIALTPKTSGVTFLKVSGGGIDFIHPEIAVR